MTNTPSIDLAQTFQLDGLDVRGRLVRLGPALAQILHGHDYPVAVAEMLSETLVLGATLASALKYDGLFTLQVQSDGPISLMVADMTSSGELRGYARFDADHVAVASQADGAKVPRLLGNGHLAFTVEQGPDLERYQGIVALEGATLAACAQTYFRASEQLETVIFLGTDLHKSTDPRAGAVMVQRMPSTADKESTEAEDEWRRGVVLLASLKLDELLDFALESDQVLYRLYHDDGVRAYAPKPLLYKCRCSREKVAATLKTLSRDEIMDETGGAHVSCEFCAATYTFTQADLDLIYDTAET
jgi:molecular chaperone Hsp33